MTTSTPAPTNIIPRVQCGTCRAIFDIARPDDLPACPSCGARMTAMSDWGARVKVRGTQSADPCGVDCQTARGLKCRCICAGMAHGIRA